MPKELFGLIGVVIGWILTSVGETIRRNSERRQRTRELTIQRGEELLSQCLQLLEWADSARKIASSGDIYIPVWTPGYRAFAIISLFYPSLNSHIVPLDDAARQYRLMLVDFATAKSKGEFISQERQVQVNEARDALQRLISKLSGSAAREITLHVQ